METEVTLELKPLGPLDVSQLQQWVQAYYAYDSIPYDSRVGAALTELVRSPGLGIAFELKLGDQACGYAVLTYGFDHEFGGRLGVLTDFFLEEKYRGQGLGPQFLELLVEFARREGLKGMEIPVMKDNVRARTLYERYGFRQSERMDHLFQRF